MPERVRRYNSNHFHDMLHELHYMIDRGEINLRPGINDTQFEEMVKRIDAQFSDNGVDIHHPLIRGMVADNDSYKNLKNFFVHIYAAGNTHANQMLRARSAHSTRTRAAINRITAAAAARTARMRRDVPRAAANEGRSRARERTARATVRNRGTVVARAAANAAIARTARRNSSRSSSRSRRSRSGTIV